MTKLTILRRRADAANGMMSDLKEEWKSNHDEAMAVADLEVVLPQFLEVANFLLAFITETNGQFFRNSPQPNYNFRRELASCADVLVGTFGSGPVAEARGFESKGYAVQGVDELRQSLTELNKAIEVLKKTCPEPNKEMLARTAQNIQKKQYKPAEEILREANDGCAG